MQASSLWHCDRTACAFSPSIATEFQTAAFMLNPLLLFFFPHWFFLGMSRLDMLSLLCSPASNWLRVSWGAYFFLTILLGYDFLPLLLLPLWLQEEGKGPRSHLTAQCQLGCAAAAWRKNALERHCFLSSVPLVLSSACQLAVACFLLKLPQCRAQT